VYLASSPAPVNILGCLREIEVKMSMSINGVPESISRESYLSLISATGIDPGAIRKLTFAADGIYAVVFAQDADGEKVIDPATGAVKHTVYIPVVD
jgi:hypothetical protein